MKFPFSDETCASNLLYWIQSILDPQPKHTGSPTYKQATFSSKLVGASLQVQAGTAIDGNLQPTLRSLDCSIGVARLSGPQGEGWL